MSTMRFALSGVGLVAAVVLFTNGAVGQGGDTIGTATVIAGLPYSDTGETADYVNDYDEVCPYTGSTSPDVVYAYTPSANETVDITLCDGSWYDTKLYVYENTHTPGAPFACNDDACEDPWGYPYVSELPGLSLIGGNTYYIVVDGFGGVWGEYTFDMAEAVPLMGACCVDQDCVATNTLPECDVLGGAWYRGEDCAAFICPVVEECGPDSIYGQIPTDPGGSWTVGPSDLNANGGCNRFESYSVGEDIGGVRFWGLTLSYPWTSCTEDPMDFEIVFWPDDGTGMPDLANPACTYSLTLAASTTTYVVAGGWTVLRWEADLEPCCDLHSGWMSVQGTSLQTPTDCWFLWYSSDKIGGGFSWFWDGAGMVPDDWDLSMCLDACSSEGVLYFSEDSNGDGLYTLDTTTGAATHIGVSGVTSQNVGLAKCDDPAQLFGSKWSELMRINTDGSGNTIIGGAGTEGLAYDKATNTLYGAINGDFFLVDPATGNNIGALASPGGDYEGLAWDAVRGGVWGLADGGDLSFYDPGTGAWTLIGNTGINFDQVALAYDAGKDVLYGKGNQSSNLYRIDPANAAAEVVGDTGIAMGGGLAFLGPTGPPPCPADVNGDGVVNELDLLAVLAAWGATSGPEDINGDGIVNVLDLLEVLANWGPCP